LRENICAGDRDPHKLWYDGLANAREWRVMVDESREDLSIRLVSRQRICAAAIFKISSSFPDTLNQT